MIKESTTIPSKALEITGSQCIIDALLSEEIDIVFGYPGGAIMPVYDALYDYLDQLNHILVRHEQGAIHAAQGYARATGKTGVVFATSGPGATNLVTGLADAMIDSTPLVCITGQVFAHLLGSDAFQETDIVNITSPITKWNYQVTDANEIPDIIAKAFFIASTGRPGPVLIDITKNAQLQLFQYRGYRKCLYIRSYRPSPHVRMPYIESAIKLINEAKKPLIIYGQGVLLGNAEREFLDFVEKSGIPVAWTILGMSAIPTDHAQAVGMLGMHGNYAPNVLTNQCDVLIAIGMRFDDRVTSRLDKYAKQAKIIHFEIDPAEIDKNISSYLAVWGDCKETLPLITKGIEKKKHDLWMQEFSKLRDIEQTELIDIEQNPAEGEITMAEVIRIINEQTMGEAIFVTDVGQHQMVTCRYAHQLHTRSNITSGGLGTMGFCLPAAMGAKLGKPERQVIAIMGDGGAQMNIQELGTIAQSNIAVKIVILNNSFLGMVRQWQELFHKERYSFTKISSPDYVKLAAAYDIDGAWVGMRENLVGVIKRMLDYDGPFMLEVKVKQDENVFPMIPQGKGVGEIVISKNQI